MYSFSSPRFTNSVSSIAFLWIVRVLSWEVSLHWKKKRQAWVFVFYPHQADNLTKSWVVYHHQQLLPHLIIQQTVQISAQVWLPLLFFSKCILCGKTTENSKIGFLNCSYNFFYFILFCFCWTLSFNMFNSSYHLSASSNA